MKDMEINTAIVERAHAGAVLTEAELLELDAVDVLSLGMLADEVRRARVGHAVTYARVLAAGAEGLSGDEAATAAIATSHEVRLTTLAPTLQDTAAAVRLLRNRIGGKRLTGFSLADLTARAWGDLAEVLGVLKAAGLDAMAEAPIDLVSADDVSAVVAAGLGPARISVRHWPGEGRVALLQRARQVVAANPSIHRFAPLSREQSVTAPTTGYHDVRMVALARLALPAIDVIEVDWQQYGPKLAQVALLFGANHLDRVPPVDDPSLGPRRATTEEVRRNILAAGFTPAEPGEAA